MPLATHVDQGIGRTQINGQIIGKIGAQETKHHDSDQVVAELPEALAAAIWQALMIPYRARQLEPKSACP
jgi:hypothetical protein